MKLTRLMVEHVVYERIRHALAKNKTEDSLVEFKKELSAEHKTAARQIAALCNAAPDEDAVWAIGFHEDSGKFHDQPVEIANWRAQVAKYFEGGVSPVDRVYSVQYEGHPLTLLHFDTTPRPFIVFRNQPGSDQEREIPWRSGNSTRSASRSELLRLFVPTITKPDFQIAFARIHGNKDLCEAKMDIFIIPRNGDRVVMPLHECEMRIESDAGVLAFPPATMGWEMPPKTQIARPLQFVFDSPTFFGVHAEHRFEGFDPVKLGQNPKVVFQCRFASSDINWTLTAMPTLEVDQGQDRQFACRHPRWFIR